MQVGKFLEFNKVCCTIIPETKVCQKEEWTDVNAELVMYLGILVSRVQVVQVGNVMD